MSTHTIRLRGAWAAAGAGGRVRHARRFGGPRLPDPAERVWLVCAGLPGPADVLLNGEPVGDAAGGRFEADVTDRLRPRNELVIELTSAEPPGDVALEVRS
jgi:hypothetical protein